MNNYENLNIPHKEALREQIISLYDRDIATVPYKFSSRNYAFIFSEGTQPSVLRISKGTPTRTSSDMLCELMWLDDLRESVHNVCNPVPSFNNHLVEQTCLDGTTYLITLFRKANGTIKMPKEWNKRHFYNCGALLGKIHRATHDGTQVGFKYKRNIWHQSPCYNFSLLDKLFPPRYKEAMTKVFDRIKSIPEDPLWYGMIHGDFQNGNLFSDWDDLWIFDFDDCCYGYFMFDIACLVYIFATSERYITEHADKSIDELIFGDDGILNSIRSGYTSEWVLPDEHWELFDDFYRLRISQVITVQLAENCFPDNITQDLFMPFIHYFEEDKSPLTKIPLVIQERAQTSVLSRLLPFLVGRLE